METILEELNMTPGIFGSMIVGKDGLVISNNWNQEIDLDMVGADSADLFNSIEAMMGEKFQYGNIDLMSLETENARLFLKNVDESTFLAVVATPKSNVGLVRAEIASASARLEERL
jgi:predicted regulator of Ras-like GTPase activity (Roadblock/LC7/MglB family)